MNINEVRTKLMRHDHLTIKQDDTGSVVELALYDAAGTVLKSVHGSCTVTLRNVNTGAVNLTKTAAITNGELSFTIDKHLEASPHTLEIVTSDGKRFPANGNFVVDITKSHKTAIVDIIQNITREEAIRDVTKAVTEYVHSHADTFRGEKGDKGDAATITENKVLSDGSISLTFSDKTVVIIPKGVKGDRGATGSKGEQGVKGDTGAKGETGAKGDKGDRGDDLTIDGVVDSVDKLPAGTTASNYLVGNDLYFRVAGQSKWQKGLTLKNEVTIKDGFFYIDGKKTTAAANESVVKDYVDKKVDELVYENRNLLLGTDFKTKHALWQSTQSPYSFANGVATKQSMPGHSYPRLMYLLENVQLKEGETYTLSFQGKSSTDKKLDVWICDVNGGSKITANQVVSYSTEWKKFVITFTAQMDSDVGTTRVQFWSNMHDSSTENTLYLKEVKLERGPKATPYSRAPEDSLPQTQQLVLHNGCTGSVSCIKDANNLVTLKYNVVIGKVIGLGANVASVPKEFSPEEYVPSLGQNAEKGTIDSFLYLTPTTGLKMWKNIAQGDHIQGQVTYRVEG